MFRLLEHIRGLLLKGDNLTKLPDKSATGSLFFKLNSFSAIKEVINTWKYEFYSNID